MDLKAVGQRIKAAREAKNLTQEELAALVNLSTTHVSVIERGLKVGQILTLLEETPKEEQKDLQFLIPFNEGADADGQYARAVRTVLDRKGYEHVDIIAPILETLPVTADDPELLMKALVCSDILYSADPHMRDQCYRSLLPDGSLHEWKDLRRWAKKIGEESTSAKSLGLVGTSASLTSITNIK